MLVVFFLIVTAGRIDTSRDTEYPWTCSARMPHFSRSLCKRKSARSKASNRQMTQCQMVFGGGSYSGASGNAVSKCEGNGVVSKDSQKLAPCDCTCGVETFMNMEHLNSDSSHVQLYKPLPAAFLISPSLHDQLPDLHQISQSGSFQDLIDQGQHPPAVQPAVEPFLPFHAATIGEV